MQSGQCLKSDIKNWKENMATLEAAARDWLTDPAWNKLFKNIFDVAEDLICRGLVALAAISLAVRLIANLPSGDLLCIVIGFTTANGTFISDVREVAGPWHTTLTAYAAQDPSCYEAVFVENVHPIKVSFWKYLLHDSITAVGLLSYKVSIIRVGLTQLEQNESDLRSNTYQTSSNWSLILNTRIWRCYASEILGCWAIVTIMICNGETENHKVRDYWHTNIGLCNWQTDRGKIHQHFSQVASHFYLLIANTFIPADAWFYCLWTNHDDDASNLSYSLREDIKKKNCIKSENGTIGGEGVRKIIEFSNIPIFHSFVFHSLSRGGGGKVNDTNFTLYTVFFFDVFPK